MRLCSYSSIQYTLISSVKKRWKSLCLIGFEFHTVIDIFMMMTARSLVEVEVEVEVRLFQQEWPRANRKSGRELIGKVAEFE